MVNTCQARGRWSDHGETLLAAIDDSELEKKVFSGYLARIITSKISNIIKDMTKALVRQDLTQDVVDELRTNIRDRIATFAKPDQLLGRRQVKVTYRGHELSVKVETVEQEMSLHIDSIIKGKGVEQGLLQPLYCENALCRATPICGSAVTSSDVIKSLLVRKEANLCSVDAAFGLEVQFFCSMSAKAGAEALKHQLLACLPGEQEDKTVAVALGEINQVLASNLHKFCGKETQGMAKACKDMLTSLSMGRSPNAPTRTASAILRAFMDKLPNF